jgi:hypothetical protein
VHALGLNFLAATCVVSLTVVTPAPAKSEASSLSFGFSQTKVAVVKEVGYRHWRSRYARHNWRYRHTVRPYYYRPSYRYFGADPGRYFGVGPGSYECYGYASLRCAAGSACSRYSARENAASAIGRLPDYIRNCQDGSP